MSRDLTPIDEFPEVPIAPAKSANEMVRRLILPPLREDRGGSFSDRRIIYMQIASIGIDLGKTTFHLVALGPAGQVLGRRKFSQKQLLTYTANLVSSLVGLEACSCARKSLSRARMRSLSLRAVFVSSR